MAKKIYIGEILGDVKASIADLQTDMSTMTDSMSMMVDKLVFIGENTSQSINVLKVKASPNIKMEMPLEDSPEIVATSTSFTKVTNITLQSLSEGIITVSGNVDLYSAGNGWVYFGIGVNGVVTQADMYRANNVWSRNRPFNINISIKKDDIISLFARSESTNVLGKIKVEANKIKFAYDLADITQGDGLIINS